MEVLPEKVRQFRSRYRQDDIGVAYRGWVHFAFTFGLSLVVIAVALWQLDSVQPMEWLTIPITFLYANLSEYWGHRGPMHHPTLGLGPIFRRHTAQHHRFFTDRAMAYESSRDFKAVLFPPILIVFFLLGFAAPAGALLSWLFTANVCWLFVATAVAYFLNYELFHWAYHNAPDAWIRRLPGLNRLRLLHLYHHDPSLMQSYNFNITYPIGDQLFGTYHRDSAGQAR